MISLENGFKRSERREIRNVECKVQSERERQISYDITYMWDLKYDTNELIYKTETDSRTESRHVVAKGEVGGGRKDWAFGISRCKLLHLEWINSKVLLYSTRETFSLHVLSRVRLFATPWTVAH